MAIASFRPGFAGVKPSRERPMRCCMGCGAATGTAWKWLCDGCFGQLPFDRKKEICGARAAREPHRVFGLSRGAGEWLAARRAKLAGE